MIMHDLWTIKEVSKLIGVPQKTILKWCECAHIRGAVRVKGVWIIPMREVKRLVAMNTTIKRALSPDGASLNDEARD